MACAWHPAQKILPSGFGIPYNTVWLWDAMLGTLIAKLEGHSAWVKTVVFSPDGLCLASGSHDCTVLLWDVMSGLPIYKLEGHSGCVTAVAFSPNGMLIAKLDGHSSVEAFTWDLTLQPPLRLVSGSSKVGPGPIVGSTPFVCSLHGRWIVVRKHEGGPLRRLCYIPPHYLPSTRILMSSQRTQSRVAVGCQDGRVIILTIPHDLILV